MSLLPLDPAETLEPDEATLTQEVLAAMLKVVADRDGTGRKRRGAHTGSHGTLLGRFAVPESLDPELRHGIFATSGTYEAVIRTSSATDGVTADYVPNMRGLAVKLLDAPGDRILEDGRRGLDFLFISAEIVPFGTIHAFRDMMKHTLTGNVAGWFRGPEGRKRTLITARTVTMDVDILGLTYWSTTPYRLGPHVVKYRLQPVADDTPDRGWRDRVREKLASRRETPAAGGEPSAEFGVGPIRTEMVARLEAGPVVYALSVQRQHDPIAQPVEDASVPWSKAPYPWEEVARLEIPSQVFDTPERDALGEGLRFAPWHVPLAQRPLGGLNRVRGRVYETTAARRVATIDREFAPPKVTERSPRDLRPVALPHNDYDLETRKANLETQRGLFPEDPDKLPGYLMCEGAPDASRPLVGWSVAAGRLSNDIALNVLANKVSAARAASGKATWLGDRLAEAAEDRAQAALAATLAAAESGSSERGSLPNDRVAVLVAGRVGGILTGGMGEGLNLFEASFPFYLYKTPVKAPRPKSLADLAALFRKLPTNPAIARHRDEADFVRRRLVGPNGRHLRRVTDAREVAFADPYIQAATGDPTVAHAVGAGRVFICDYSLLADVLERKAPVDDLVMYAYAPTLVLAVPKGGGQLRAVAIRTGPEREAPVCAPGDGWGWEIGKHVVEVADISWFEPITHLGLTHLVLEPVGLATFRNLPGNHPIARLLLPHLEGTLSVNDMAVNHLLADGGAIDQTFAATMPSIRRAAVQAAVAYDVRRDTLPALLARQGLDDREVLPDHPWRDDALRVHGAIGRWVNAYVRRAYRFEGIRLWDAELRAWIAALSRPAGQGGITGLGTVATLADLSAVLTEFIYTASAGHAAVNFPQWSDAGFAGRMPGAGYAPIPTGRPATEADWLAMLPPVDKAELHAEFLYLLGSLYYTRLGVYDGIDDGVFTDPVVTETLLPAFQAELAQIERQIEDDNADASRRAAPYTHLLPSRIPQSINV